MRYLYAGDIVSVTRYGKTELGIVISDKINKSCSDRIVWAEFNGWKSWVFRSSCEVIKTKGN